MSNIAKGLWKDGISVAEGNFLVCTDGADRSSPALFVSFLWFLLSRQACALLKGQPCLLLRGQRWCCLFLQLLTRVGEGTVVVQEAKRSRTRCGALTGVCTLSYQRLNQAVLLLYPLLRQHLSGMIYIIQFISPIKTAEFSNSGRRRGFFSPVYDTEDIILNYPEAWKSAGAQPESVRTTGQFVFVSITLTLALKPHSRCSETQRCSGWRLMGCPTFPVIFRHQDRFLPMKQINCVTFVSFPMKDPPDLGLFKQLQL